MPFRHSVCAVCPVMGTKVPGGAGLQLLWLLEGWKLPAAQGVGMLCPVPEKVPGGVGEQVACPELPV